MSGKFKLEIELGNDEMNSPARVADALKELLQVLYSAEEKVRSLKARIADDNGNSVGKWSYENDRAEDEEEDSDE